MENGLQPFEGQWLFLDKKICILFLTHGLQFVNTQSEMVQNQKQNKILG